jgi:hypothetical protein
MIEHIQLGMTIHGRLIWRMELLALECLDNELLDDGNPNVDQAAEMIPPFTTIVNTSKIPNVAALAS